MLTASKLRDSIRRQLWPSGEPEALLNSHDLHFQEALALVAKWVKGEREGVVSTFEFCKTSYKCGMTVIPAPRGVIKRVWTVCADWCDPVFYAPSKWPQPECDGRRIIAFSGITSSGKALPLGFQDADSSTDSVAGRARRGIWARERDNIYLAPYIQSTEMVVIEWDGIKVEWKDEDPVNEDVDYRNVLKLFLQAFHERDHGDMGRALSFHNPRAMRQPELAGSADLALAELMNWDDEKRRQRRDTGECAEFPPPGRCLIPAALEDTCEIPEPPGPLVLAHIGNFGSGDDNADLVAAVVQGIGPTYILGSAPNAYNEDTSSQNYDDVVGTNYHSFIHPYVGSQGEGAERNAFWPSPGTVDWLHDGDLSTYQAFFPLPNNGRYYDVCLGPIHLFVLDALSTEPDGATEDSAQALWLKAKLWMARNEPSWKVVLMGDEAPYSTLGSTTARRWSFKSWGADLVLSGKGNYERVSKLGLQYINNGSGGRTLETTLNSAIEGRQYYDEENYGAGRIVATRCSLRYEFIDVGGVIRDSVQLTRPSIGECASAVVAATLEQGSLMNFLPPVVETEQTQQQFFSFAGNPNGGLTAPGPLPCMCWDSVNNVYWVKDDGLLTNTGWH